MNIRFSKMQGLANDFVVIDALDQAVFLSTDALCRLADRRLGVGCDQILLIKPCTEDKADFFYQIFNADGTEVAQCGNGARCVAKYLVQKGITAKKEIRLLTQTTLLQAEVLSDGAVRVNMAQPSFLPADIPIQATQAEQYSLWHNGVELNFAALSMGNPHAVFVVDNLSQYPVDEIAKNLQQTELFPAGVNVGFVEIISKKQIGLRVVERGVGETQACGSGACAGVVAAHMLGLVDTMVTVSLLGGGLEIEWDGAGSAVWMTGPAEHVFDGDYFAGGCTHEKYDKGTHLFGRCD